MEFYDIITQFKDQLRTKGKKEVRSAFKEIAPKLLQFLIQHLFLYNEFEIGLFTNTSKQGKEINGSIVTFDQYNIDEQLSLLMVNKLKLILELNFFDYDDERHSFQYVLSEVDRKIIPVGLINLMLDVIKNDESITVTPNTLINNA